MARDKRIDTSVQYIEEELEKYHLKRDKVNFVRLLIEDLESKLILLEINDNNDLELDNFDDDD